MSKVKKWVLYEKRKEKRNVSYGAKIKMLAGLHCFQREKGRIYLLGYFRFERLFTMLDSWPSSNKESLFPLLPSSPLLLFTLTLHPPSYKDPVVTLGPLRKS